MKPQTNNIKQHKRMNSILTSLSLGSATNVSFISRMRLLYSATTAFCMAVAHALEKLSPSTFDAAPDSFGSRLFVCLSFKLLYDVQGHCVRFFAYQLQKQ
eukprot:c11594_g1_i1.p1 GENE.c11594_g1_i1~~c11594_g1_i1.p1  ORF type:complete len:100 (-),score=9.09 c11594_g1_i1:4-303(-)